MKFKLLSLILSFTIFNFQSLKSIHLEGFFLLNKTEKTVLVKIEKLKRGEPAEITNYKLEPKKFINIKNTSDCRFKIYAQTPEKNLKIETELVLDGSFCVQVYSIIHLERQEVIKELGEFLPAPGLQKLTSEYKGDFLEIIQDQEALKSIINQMSLEVKKLSKAAQKSERIKVNKIKSDIIE